MTNDAANKAHLALPLPLVQVVDDETRAEARAEQRKRASVDYQVHNNGTSLPLL